VGDLISTDDFMPSPTLALVASPSLPPQDFEAIWVANETRCVCLPACLSAHLAGWLAGWPAGMAGWAG